MSNASPAAPRRDRAGWPPGSRRARHGAFSSLLVMAVLTAAAIAALTPTGWLAACGSSPTLATTPTPDTTSSGVSSPSVTAAAHPAVTAGPVPAGAVHAARRYWLLVDEHRYGALLTVVTADSTCAAAVRGGHAAGFFGIDAVRVLSHEQRVDPAPPPHTTLEFAMTVDIRPRAGSAWDGGPTLVFMCLRHAHGRWLVSEAGTGP